MRSSRSSRQGCRRRTDHRRRHLRLLGAHHRHRHRQARRDRRPSPGDLRSVRRHRRDGPDHRHGRQPRLRPRLQSRLRDRACSPSTSTSTRPSACSARCSGGPSGSSTASRPTRSMPRPTTATAMPCPSATSSPRPSSPAPAAIRRFGRGNWLKDIRSVATEQIPDWVLSNYFYREMGWVIRAVSTVPAAPHRHAASALAVEALSRAGIVNVNFILNNPLSSVRSASSATSSTSHRRQHADPVLHAGRGDPGLGRPARPPQAPSRRFRITAALSSVEGQGNEPYLDRARRLRRESRHRDLPLRPYP